MTDKERKNKEILNKYEKAKRILYRYIELAMVLEDVENPIGWALRKTWEYYDGPKYCANCGKMYDQFKGENNEAFRGHNED